MSREVEFLNMSQKNDQFGQAMFNLNKTLPKLTNDDYNSNIGKNLARRSVYSSKVGTQPFEFNMSGRNNSMDQSEALHKQLFAFDVANVRITKPGPSIKISSSTAWHNEEAQKLIRL